MAAAAGAASATSQSLSLSEPECRAAADRDPASACGLRSLAAVGFPSHDSPADSVGLWPSRAGPGASLAAVAQAGTGPGPGPSHSDRAESVSQLERRTSRSRVTATVIGPPRLGRGLRVMMHVDHNMMRPPVSWPNTKVFESPAYCLAKFKFRRSPAATG